VGNDCRLFYYKHVFKLWIFSQNGKVERRKVPVPPNRYTPLKENWMKIFEPVVEHLHLQIRFNLGSRNVEIKVSLA
jgi:RNA-binding protein PNO1